MQSLLNICAKPGKEKIFGGNSGGNEKEAFSKCL